MPKSWKFILVISLDHRPRFSADKVGFECLILNRLRFGDDEPIDIQHSILLTECCPGLEKQDFVRFGLYDILAHVYRLTISHIQHTICATVADESQVELLKSRLVLPC